MNRVCVASMGVLAVLLAGCGSSPATVAELATPALAPGSTTPDPVGSSTSDAPTSVEGDGVPGRDALDELRDQVLADRSERQEQFGSLVGQSSEPMFGGDRSHEALGVTMLAAGSSFDIQSPSQYWVQPHTTQATLTIGDSAPIELTADDETHTVTATLPPVPDEPGTIIRLHWELDTEYGPTVADDVAMVVVPSVVVTAALLPEGRLVIANAGTVPIDVVGEVAFESRDGTPTGNGHLLDPLGVLRPGAVRESVIAAAAYDDCVRVVIEPVTDGDTDVPDVLTCLADAVAQPVTDRFPGPEQLLLTSDGPSDVGDATLYRGPSHCGWESVVSLSLPLDGSAAGPVGGFQANRTFLRDADSVVGAMSGTPTFGTMPPDAATDTGLRIAGAQVLVGAANDRAVYVANGEAWERWPEALNRLACA